MAEGPGLLHRANNIFILELSGVEDIIKYSKILEHLATKSQLLKSEK